MQPELFTCQECEFVSEYECCPICYPHLTDFDFPEEIIERGEYWADHWGGFYDS